MDTADKHFSGVFSERHNQGDTLSQFDSTEFSFSDGLISQFAKTSNKDKISLCVVGKTNWIIAWRNTPNSW